MFKFKTAGIKIRMKMVSHITVKMNAGELFFYEDKFPQLKGLNYEKVKLVKDVMRSDNFALGEIDGHLTLIPVECIL